MSNNRDRWEQALDIELEKLQICQKEHNFKSCLSCSKINDCRIRDNYVNSVYTSMSKGKGGGFEF